MKPVKQIIIEMSKMALWSQEERQKVFKSLAVNLWSGDAKVLFLKFKKSSEQVGKLFWDIRILGEWDMLDGHMM